MNPYYQQPQHHLQAPQIYGQQQQSFQAVPSVAPPNFYQQQAWPPGFGAVPQYQVPYQLPQTPYQAVAQPIQSMPAPVASQQMKQGIAEPPPLPKSTPVPELPPRPPPPEENVKPPPPPDEQRSVSSVTSNLKSGTIASQVNNNATMTAMQLQSSLSFGNIKTKPLTGDEDLETLNTQLKQLEGQMKNYQSEYEKWHKEFTAWQKQHENHPDQKQYIQYQQKYQKMIEQQQRSLQQQYIELQKRIKVKQNQQMMTTQTGNNNVSSKSQAFPNQQSQQNMYGGTAQNTPASFSSSNVYNKPSNMQDYAKNLQHQNSASVASSADTNLQSSQYSQGGSYSGNQNQFQNASDNYQHKIAQDNYTNFGSNLKECISQNQNKNNQYGDQQSANCLPQNQQTSNYSQSSQQTSYYNQPNQASSSQSSGMFASNKWSSNQQQSNQSSNHPTTSNWSSSNPPSEKPSSDQWSSNQGSSQSSTRSSNYQSSENSSAGQWGTNTHASSQPASTSQWSSNYQSSAQPSSNSWGSNYQSSEQRSSTQWSSNSNSVEKPVWSSTQKPLGNQSSSLWSTNQQTSNKPTSYQNSSEFHPATNLQPPKEPPTSQMNANVPYQNQLQKSQIRQQTPQNQSIPSRVSVPGPRVPHTGSTTPRMPSRGPAPGPRAQQGGSAAGSRMPDAASTASPRMPARGPAPGPRAPQGGTATGPRMPGAATAASPRMPARGPAPGPRAPQGGAATGSRMPVGASIASPRMPARGPSPGPRAPQGGTATGPRMPGAATAASPRMPVRGQAPNPRIPQTGSMSSPRMPARVPAPGPRTPQGGTATGPRMPLLASAASPRMPLRGAAPAPRMPQGGSATSARIPARGPAPSPRIPQGGSIIGARPSQAASASGPRMPLRGPSPAPRMPIKGSVPDSGNQAQEKQKDPAPLPSLMSQNITNESKYKQIDKMSNERLLFSDSEDSSHNEAEKGLQKSSDLGNQVKGTADSHEQQIQPPQDGENFWDDDVSDFNIWDSKRGIPEKQFTENQENSQDQLSSQQKPVDQLEASHLDKTLSVSQANSLRPVLGSERKIMPVLSASSNSIRQQIVSTNSFSKPAENKPSSSASVYQTSSVTTHSSRTSVLGEPGVTKPEINSAPAVEPLAKTATAVSTAVSATVTSVTSSTTTAVTSVSMSDSKAIPSFQPAVSQSQPSFAPRQPGGPARPFGPNSGPTSSRPPFGPRGGVASGVRGPRSLHAGRGGSFNTAAPQPTVTENSNLSSPSQWTPIHKVSEIKHGTCRYFPDCRFGAACRFKHPDCPDFIYCQNRNCALEHYEPPKDTSENYQNNRKFIDEEQHQSFSSQRTEDDGYQNQRHSQSDDYYDNRVSSEYYDRSKYYYDSNERQGEYSQNENYYSNDQYYSQRYDDDYTQRRNDGPENNYDQYQDYPSDRYNTDRNTADENRPSGPGYSSDYEPERKRLHEESEGDQYGTSTAPRGEFFRERYEFDKRYRDWEKQHFPVDDPTREWEFEMRRRELLGQQEADKSRDYARSYDYDRDAEGYRKSYDGYERPYDDRYDDPAYRRDPLYGRPSEPIRPVVFDYGHEKKLGLYDVDLSKLNDDNNATLSERPISPSKQQPDRMLSPRRSPRRSRSPHRRSYSPRRSESRSRRSASPSRRRRSRRSPSPRRRSPSRDHRRRDRSRERHTSRDREHSRSRSTSARPRENEDRKSRSDASRSYGSRIENERGIMGYDDGRMQNIKEPGPETVAINDLLEKPGRDSRPKQIVIILRGPPGCGKTHIAKIIKDKEVSFGAHAPRILALDDYFITESDVYEKDEETGKRVKVKKMEYVYEEEMEAAYRVSLLKSFNKTLDNGYFPMVIIDAINDKVENFQKFWSDGKHKGFEVFIAEMQGDASDCADKNIHNWSQTDIQKMLDNWEPTPNHFKRLDVRSLVQDATIKEVEMEEIEQPVEEEQKEEKEGEKEEDVDEEECGTFHVPMKSKWEESKEEQLAKLDGIRSNKEKKSIKNSILDDDEYDDDPYDEKEEDMRIGKKRVRWADIEERKMLEHRKRIGFCIGTDWSVLTDPNAQVPL